GLEHRTVAERSRRADVEGAAYEVPKALGARGHDEVHEAEAVKERHEVDYPDKVEHDDGDESRGLAILADDAQAAESLTDGLAVPEPLEEDEVQPRDQELEQDHPTGPIVEGWVDLGELLEREPDCEHEHEDDDEVRHRREPTVAGAGELKAEHDVIGRLNFEPAHRDCHR